MTRDERNPVTGSYTVHVPKNIDGTFATDPKPAGRIITPKSGRDELIEQAALNAVAGEEDQRTDYYLDAARDWLEILEPLIREQVAKDLEAADGVDGWYFARIARGES